MDRAFRILFVGRLIPAKRPEAVLRAFARLSAAHPELSLDFVGDGPDQTRLEKLAGELGVQSKLVFHGRKRQLEIVDMYRSALATVIASGGNDAPEGLGLVAIEALGSGCPVISVPNVALQSALPATAPIRYARDSSVESLAQAILDLIESPDDGSEPDLSWREQVAQRFGWDSVAADYSELLYSLVQASPR